ncbi:MAG: bifunctional PIG-L family deacetylase/class I SAM-dependent methyltransferase [Fulvimarina manganoxydans]|uniref:bifunctional PIG-L family deacetylase/class I SAM-dependent methyltransferase n=1 Tax=Fulvimarina manganoxydans TaxID=937218 RepID=UPI002355B777|nr:bifunctional PIG-L family deacetylase/class I SAM-dependent methyltransferase [Fulvimarina manganoxydans]MCK5932687.1 bifunctional PIG-L family deacetylase/class I SAM-dependent methyltransferase [Fulvimarina manganoxydans]
MSDTYAHWLARCAKAPSTKAHRLLGTGGLVVIAPHPDDETLGASALLSEAAHSGRPVGIVALTDGEASHPGSKAFPRERLAEVRRSEQEAALTALGLRQVRWLRLSLPDGGAGRDPRWADAPARIAAFCHAIGAETLSAPHPGDPHPDHHAAAALAEEVRTLRPDLRLLFYQVWSMRLSGEAPYRHEQLLPFGIATDPEAKRRAIACHASQLGQLIADDPDGFVLPDWFLTAQAAPREIHALAPMRGSVPPPSHFAALYADGGDPWHVRSSRYEAAKRADNCDQLKGRTYRAGLDIGCGEGHLSRALIESGIALGVTGIDREGAIVERASAVHADLASLTFRSGSLPDDLPDGPFDLVVMSEVLYFLDEQGLSALATKVEKRLAPGADLLIVSYRGETGTPLSGRQSHDLLVALFGETLRSISLRERENYQAELLRFRREAEEGWADTAPSR